MSKAIIFLFSFHGFNISHSVAVSLLGGRASLYKGHGKVQHLCLWWLGKRKTKTDQVMLLLAKFPKYTHLLNILSYYQFIEEFHHRLSKSSQDPFTSQKSIIRQPGPKIETFSIGLLRLKSYNKIKIHKPVASLHINCGQTK